MKRQITALSIDLGHANVKLAYPSAKGVSTKIFPALAPTVDSGEDSLVEGAARADGVQVTVDGLTYFIGPGAAAHLRSTESKVSQHGYTKTAEYQALMLGALSLAIQGCGYTAGQSVEVGCLGLGLPLTTYTEERAPLIKKWKDAFDVPVTGGTVRVCVLEIALCPQPVGALVEYAATTSSIDAINNTNALVLDAGGGTLDYLVTAGGLIVNNPRSGANMNSIDLCVRAVAQKIVKGNAVQGLLSNPYNLQRISAAITQRKPIRLPILTEDVQVEDYWPAVETIINRGLDEVENKVGDPGDIGLVLAVGGGGAFFAERCKERVPHFRDKVVLLGDPLYTNVLGFYRLAERKGASLLSAMKLASAGVAA